MYDTKGNSQKLNPCHFHVPLPWRLYMNGRWHTIASDTQAFYVYASPPVLLLVTCGVFNS